MAGKPQEYVPPGGVDDLATALAPLRIQRQEAFVRAYIETGNASEAARRAGYSEKSANRAGHKLLTYRHIQDALSAARVVLAKRTEFDFAKASDEIKRATEFAYATKNATAAVRGAELLAKLHGHLVERQDIRAQGDVIFRFPERRDVEPAPTIEGRVVGEER